MTTAFATSLGDGVLGVDPNKSTNDNRGFVVLCIPGLEGDTMRNPYLGLLQQSLRDQGVEYRSGNLWELWLGRYDVIHVHFPEYLVESTVLSRSIAKAVLMYSGIIWARLRGRPAIWTVHNTSAHQPRHRWLEKASWRIWSVLSCGAIFLGTSTIKQALREHPWITRRPRCCIPHGHYRTIVGASISKLRARNALSIAPNAKVAILFGGIAKYKGVLELVEIFTSCRGTNYLLILAGRLSSDLQIGPDANRLRRALLLDNRIRAHFASLDDAHLRLLVAAADLAILPYQRVLNSGAVMYALSCDRPVCAPRLGGIRDVFDKVGEHWVFAYDAPLTAEVFEKSLQSAVASSPMFRPDLSHFEWRRIAEAHLRFYRLVTRRRARGEN